MAKCKDAEAVVGTGARRLNIPKQKALPSKAAWRDVLAAKNIQAALDAANHVNMAEARSRDIFKELMKMRFGITVDAKQSRNPGKHGITKWYWKRDGFYNGPNEMGAVSKTKKDRQADLSAELVNMVEMLNRKSKGGVKLTAAQVVDLYYEKAPAYDKLGTDYTRTWFTAVKLKLDDMSARAAYIDAIEREYIKQMESQDGYDWAAIEGRELYQEEKMGPDDDIAGSMPSVGIDGTGTTPSTEAMAKYVHALAKRFGVDGAGSVEEVNMLVTEYKTIEDAFKALEAAGIKPTEQGRAAWWLPGKTNGEHIRALLAGEVTETVVMEEAGKDPKFKPRQVGDIVPIKEGNVEILEVTYNPNVGAKVGWKKPRRGQKSFFTYKIRRTDAKSSYFKFLHNGYNYVISTPLTADNMVLTMRVGAADRIAASQIVQNQTEMDYSTAKYFLSDVPWGIRQKLEIVKINNYRDAKQVAPAKSLGIEHTKGNTTSEPVDTGPRREGPRLRQPYETDDYLQRRRDSQQPAPPQVAPTMAQIPFGGNEGKVELYTIKVKDNGFRIWKMKDWSSQPTVDGDIVLKTIRSTEEMKDLAFRAGAGVISDTKTIEEVTAVQVAFLPVAERDGWTMELERMTVGRMVELGYVPNEARKYIRERDVRRAIELGMPPPSGFENDLTGATIWPMWFLPTKRGMWWENKVAEREQLESNSRHNEHLQIQAELAASRILWSMGEYLMQESKGHVGWAMTPDGVFEIFTKDEVRQRPNRAGVRHNDQLMDPNYQAAEFVPGYSMGQQWYMADAVSDIDFEGYRTAREVVPADMMPQGAQLPSGSISAPKPVARLRLVRADGKNFIGGRMLDRNPRPILARTFTVFKNRGVITSDGFKVETNVSIEQLTTGIDDKTGKRFDLTVEQIADKVNAYRHSGLVFHPEDVMALEAWLEVRSQKAPNNASTSQQESRYDVGESLFDEYGEFYETTFEEQLSLFEEGSLEQAEYLEEHLDEYMMDSAELGMSEDMQQDEDAEFDGTQDAVCD